MTKTIIIILIVGLIAESAFFYYYSLKTSEIIKNLRNKIKKLAKTVGKKKPELSLLQIGRTEYRVSIEIIDPISLANRESKLASIASNFAPDLITREVYRQLQKEVMMVMEKRNIKANVTITTQ